jgi:hypothetical protein
MACRLITTRHDDGGGLSNYDIVVPVGENTLTAKGKTP